MNSQLSAKLKTLPIQPGVYFHKDKNGTIIYVGKAANLKNRVRQYFQNIAAKDVKTRALVAEIAMTDWITVETEIDALFLESEMIKRYKPQYNILLRDDKSPTYVRIGFKDEIPAVSFTRAPLDDGGEYFGPFYNGSAVKKSVRLMRKIFPYYLNQKLPKKGNLDYQIGLTPGLENYEVGSLEFVEKLSEYKKNLRVLARYLKGERKKIQREIERDMKIAAGVHDFELAAKKRNQLRDLSELGRQIIFSREEFLDISKDHAMVRLTEILSLEQPPKRIEAYDISHTGGQNTVASMVVFTNGLADKREYRKFKMRAGGNDDYLHMKEVLTRRFSARNAKWPRPELILIDGGKGQLAVAIQVVNELMMKSGQAPIPIVSVAKRDEEIMISRIGSNIKLDWVEHKLKLPPDNEIEIREDGDFIAINLHKNQTHSHGHARNLLGETSAEYSDLTKLFQRVRDESHRFAINYHSSLRAKSQTKNILEEIEGVGPKTRAKLLRKFGSLKKIRETSETEIAQIIGEKNAQNVKEFLKNQA